MFVKSYFGVTNMWTTFQQIWEGLGIQLCSLDVELLCKVFVFEGKKGKGVDLYAYITVKKKLIKICLNVSIENNNLLNIFN